MPDAQARKHPSGIIEATAFHPDGIAQQKPQLNTKARCIQRGKHSIGQAGQAKEEGVCVLSW